MLATTLRYSVRATALLAVAAASPCLFAQVQIHRVDGAVTGEELGMAVAGGGDLDGDGRDDFLVGTPGDENGTGMQTGSVTAWSGLDGSMLFERFGDATGDEFGTAVAFVGDCNADGFADFAAATGLNLTSGYARVYSGVDGSLLFSYSSTEAAGFSGGLSVAAAGDVDADGYDDVIVGVVNETATGRVSVLSGLDGTEVFGLLGSSQGEGFGNAVAGAGDVDGDGHDDFLIGIRSLLPIFPGAVQVRSGADASVLFEYAPGSGTSPVVVGPSVGGAVAGVGDLNVDGFDDFAFGEFDHAANGLSSGRAYVCSGADGSLLFDVLGTQQFQALGQTVAGAGDVNGDRVPDVAVGAPGFGLSTDPGSVQVHSGVDGSLLATLAGTQNSERYGLSISGAGDVDGDGFADVVAGAPTFASNPGPGSAVVSSLAFTGTPSRERTFGVGCPLGLVRTPRMSFSKRAFIDDSVLVELRGGPPAGISTLFFGVLTPVPLDIIGLTGCTLMTTDIWGEVPLGLDGNGQVSFPLPFPNDPNMIGLGFIAQWITPEPIAPFAIPLSFSNGLDLLIGG